ncbi:DUF805 domain-containing protein [Aquipuribacter nitratireducens]|uniref:DUF805 domain-containing protein n=1 Tax=Aquipuribacter nitratireducens TaxID=650104 RepID=A0ABW0GK79_9MICO
MLRKTFTWSGRARRSEFWWWTLAALAVYVLAIAVELQVDPSGDSVWLTGATWLALLLPTLAVTVRQLHDRSFSALRLRQLGRTQQVRAERSPARTTRRRVVVAVTSRAPPPEPLRLRAAPPP